MANLFIKVGTIEVPANSKPFAVKNPLDRMYGIIASVEKGCLEALSFPTDQPQEASVLIVEELTRSATTEEIVREIGSLKASIIDFSKLWFAMRLQRKGNEDGALNVSGARNLAFVRTKAGDPRTVHFLWCDCCQGWNWSECPIDSHPKWAVWTPDEMPLDGWHPGTRIIRRKID